MKKFFMGLLLALTTLTANAQFEAGKTYINASFSGLGVSYSKLEKLRFDVDANAGAFVARDLLLYGRFGIDQKQVTLTKHVGNTNKEYDVFLNEIVVGAGLRYYIEQNGIYLGLGAEYGHTERTKKYDNFYITPEVGYAFFVNQYLTIEPALYYHMSLNDFSDASKVGLKLGLGFYF